MGIFFGDFIGMIMGKSWEHIMENHLVNKQFAKWKMVIEIVNFPINSMVIVHRFFVYAYQRVNKSLWDNDGVMMRYNSLDGEKLYVTTKSL